MKYWAVEPAVSSLAPTERVMTQRVRPSLESVRGKRSGHSHTAACEPMPWPKSLAWLQALRSVERKRETRSPAETIMIQALESSCQKTLGSRKSLRPSLGMTGLPEKRRQVRPRSLE